MSNRATSARAIAAAGLALAAAMNVAPATAGLDRLHKQAVEDGRLCMIDHHHFISSGAWPSRDMAMATATRRWESFTRTEYGRPWGSLAKAADVTWKCSARDSRRGPQVSCELAARPCR